MNLIKKPSKLPLLAIMAPTALAIPLQGFSQKNQTTQPNIIYIYLDDMGYGEPGCYGQEKIHTPNIDKLAQEGMRFTQHYSGAPVSAPSRCMLMTGKHGGHAYIRGNYELGGWEDSTEGGQMPLPEGTFTLPKMMKQAGYVTGAIGKWGLGFVDNTGDPNLQGFDYFYGYLCQKQAHNFYTTHLWENGRWDTLQNKNIKVHQGALSKSATDEDFNKFIGTDYSVTKMAEKTLTFITENKNKPFFLYLPYTGPHVSLQAPPEAVAQYIGQFEETPYYGERNYVPCKYPRSTYAAMITYTDGVVGQIMKLLKDLNIDKNTIVMFSSDNGATFPMAGGADVEFFKSVGDFRGYKMDLYEGGIRIPFIVRWPGHVPQGVTSDLVSAQFDLMVTLAELTNTKLTSTDGISFLPTILGKKQNQQHPYLYFEYPEKGGQIAVRMGNWKGVKSNMVQDKHASWEIYDLAKDPEEKNNIANQHPEWVKQFENIAKKEHQNSHLKEWEFVNPKF